MHSMQSSKQHPNVHCSAPPKSCSEQHFGMFYHQNRSSEPQVWHLTQNSLAYHIEKLSMTIESQHPKSQYKSKSVRCTYVYIFVCLFLCFSLCSYYMWVYLWFVIFICGLLYLAVDVGFFLAFIILFVSFFAESS